jgi:RNA polymerase sigma-70 factor (ECF subfamily)
MASPKQRTDGPSAQGLQDLALVRTALAGEEAARNRLVEALAVLPDVIKRKQVRLGLLLSEHEIEDVVQVVLLALWRKLPRFDGRVPIVQWGSGFAVLELLKAAARSAQRRARSNPLPDALAAPQPRPSETAERVAEFCRDLTATDQEILRLRHFEERTFEEIAECLHMVVGSVKTRYYRALERLRRRLGAPNPE